MQVHARPPAEEAIYASCRGGHLYTHASLTRSVVMMCIVCTAIINMHIYIIYYTGGPKPPEEEAHFWGRGRPPPSSSHGGLLMRRYACYARHVMHAVAVMSPFCIEGGHGDAPPQGLGGDGGADEAASTSCTVIAGPSCRGGSDRGRHALMQECMCIYAGLEYYICMSAMRGTPGWPPSRGHSSATKAARGPSPALSS